MMEKITVTELKKISEEYGLKPVSIRGTNNVMIAKKIKESYEILSWDIFENRLINRGLAVYKDKNNWLKIMKNR